MVNIETVIL